MVYSPRFGLVLQPIRDSYSTNNRKFLVVGGGWVVVCKPNLVISIFELINMLANVSHTQATRTNILTQLYTNYSSCSPE